MAEKVTRRPEEFEAQAKALGLAIWPHHSCGLCRYIVRYVFEDGVVYFDNGCYCTMSPDNRRPSSWEKVAEHFNAHRTGRAIAEANAFWGFDRPDYAPPEIPVGRPKIFMFCIAYNGRNVRGLAITEEGELLGEQLSSSPSWSKSDMRAHFVDAYRAAFPSGYELVWLDPPYRDEAFARAWKSFYATVTDWAAPSFKRTEHSHAS